ncbi:MAG: TolC family protein [Desulfuromonadales bacterium]|nr:TolC family protein [Desulfuromonadales bacterium]
MIVFAVIVCWSSNVIASDQLIRLSLGEAIRMAAEKNLDVRAELYNPAQFEAEINRNRAIYDPSLTIQASYSDTTNPVSSTSTTFSNRGQSFQLNTSISQLFWSGAIASLGFNNNYSSVNPSTGQNGFWQSSLGVSISQPLLKNAGRDAIEINISIARLSKFASLEHFKNVLQNTVTQVRTDYFKLYSLREQLEVRKVSLALARKILSETKARVGAGVLPAMEILNAEFGVTSREKDLIDAEKSVSDQVDSLRLLLQISSTAEIVVTDLPRKEQYLPDQDEAIRHALMRPDIKELKRNLDISELQTRVFSNNIRPDLSLVLSGSLVGQDHSYGGDMERIGSIDFPAWSVGLVFSYPLGNHAAENDYRKSRLKNAQTTLQIRSLEQSAINDVLNSIRSIKSAYKQIEVADRGRAFAEERLRAFMRKNEVGLATTRDVLDVENDLATAKNNQITAAVAYNDAITRHLQVTGELLEMEGVRVVEGDADKLYTNTR